jgi:hypothetical protein
MSSRRRCAVLLPALVLAGRNSDQVTVYDRFGGVVWTRNPFGNGEVRTRAVRAPARSRSGTA